MSCRRKAPPFHGCCQCRGARRHSDAGQAHRHRGSGGDIARGTTVPIYDSLHARRCRQAQALAEVQRAFADNPKSAADAAGRRVLVTPGFGAHDLLGGAGRPVRDLDVEALAPTDPGQSRCRSPPGPDQPPRPAAHRSARAAGQPRPPLPAAGARSGRSPQGGDCRIANHQPHLTGDTTRRNASSAEAGEDIAGVAGHQVPDAGSAGVGSGRCRRLVMRGRGRVPTRCCRLR
jgi:hypothetical protein